MGNQEVGLLEICLTTNIVRQMQRPGPERRGLRLSFVCRDAHQLEGK